MSADIDQIAADAVTHYVKIAQQRRHGRTWREFAPSWVYELTEPEIAALIDAITPTPGVYRTIFPPDWTMQHYRDWMADPTTAQQRPRILQSPQTGA